MEITLKHELMFPEMMKVANALLEKGYECSEYYLDSESGDGYIHFTGDGKYIILTISSFKVRGCTPQEGLKLFEELGLE